MALSLEKFKKAQEFTLKNRQELDEKIEEKVSEIEDKIKELDTKFTLKTEEITLNLNLLSVELQKFKEETAKVHEAFRQKIKKFKVKVAEKFEAIATCIEKWKMATETGLTLLKQTDEHIEQRMTLGFERSDSKLHELQSGLSIAQFKLDQESQERKD